MSHAEQPTRVLFVHGMGRSPISGLPLLWRLRKRGFRVDVVAYLAATESFQEIVEQVKANILELSQNGRYVLIGHSLGGIILRAALQQLPALSTQPIHLFLLGSPVKPPRLANKSRHELGFQLFSGDCGQLLASNQRMHGIAMPNIPVTAIVGTRGFILTKKYFQDELNDGVVSISEVSHNQIDDYIKVPVIHTFLPSSRKVSNIIIEFLETHRPVMNAE